MEGKSRSWKLADSESSTARKLAPGLEGRSGRGRELPGSGQGLKMWSRAVADGFDFRS